MKYRPAVDLWVPETQDAVRDGSLPLQTGQWVICGSRTRKSRFVCVTQGGSIWCVHPDGESVKMDRFRTCCKTWKQS